MRCGVAILLVCLAWIAWADEPRPRARDIGLVIGTFDTGPFNAITDVGGVRVGHATKIEGDTIRTGATAIIPGPGNLYTHPMPAWIHTFNGYGKLIGETQARAFGELETPILLTCRRRSSMPRSRPPLWRAIAVNWKPFPWTGCERFSSITTPCVGTGRCHPAAIDEEQS